MFIVFFYFFLYKFEKKKKINSMRIPFFLFLVAKFNNSK